MTGAEHTAFGVSLPQPVSSDQCLSCDICCRFPEKSSPLAPYFTPEEVEKAVRGGISPDRFRDKTRGRIELIPHPAGDGYICPAFDPGKNGCRIYAYRPLDCVLYPFALMRAREGKKVLLGYDRKCPVISNEIFGEAVYQAAREMIGRLSIKRIRTVIRENPGLVGDFQPDVMVLGLLDQEEGTPSPESSGLTRLGEADRFLFENALGKSEKENLLSAYAWASLWIWRDHLEYYWKVIQGRFCLFAKSRDGFFMPILPIGGPVAEPVIKNCFELMDAMNPDPAVTRIENVGKETLGRLKKAGYSGIPVEQEYLYETREIIDFAGDRFKSQRWAENRFHRDHEKSVVRFERYREDDLEECLGLYKKWTGQKAPPDSKTESRLMLEDSFSAHKRALVEAYRLGLRVRVVRINGRIVGYTAGFPFREGIFCVLLEVADRAIQGLSVFLFREFCREMKTHPRIHAMGDSGLESLRKAKTSYHPKDTLPVFIVGRK